MNGSPALDNPILKNGVQKGSKTLSESEKSFPIEVFPKEVQVIILELHRKAKYPIEYLGGALLSAMATAIGTTHICKLDDDKIDCAMLWIVMIGNSSTNKSRSIKKFFEPIVQKDVELYKEYQQELEKWFDSNCIGKKPVAKRYIVQDYTQEALIKTLSENPKGLVAYVDEVRNWYKSFDRYNKTGLEHWYCQVWNQEVIDYSRKNEYIRVDTPFFNVVGGLQPFYLSEFANKSNLANGLIYRFLFTSSKEIDYPKWQLNKESIKPVLDKWNKILNKVLDLPFTENPTVLGFNDRAKHDIINRQNHSAKAVNHLKSHINFGIQGKIDSYMLRLSLVLEFFYYGCGESSKTEISRESVNGALKLCEYFKSNIETVISNGLNVRTGKSQKVQFYNELPTEFDINIATEIAERLGIERSYKYKCLKSEYDYKLVSENPSKWIKLQ